MNDELNIRIRKHSYPPIYRSLNPKSYKGNRSISLIGFWVKSDWSLIDSLLGSRQESYFKEALRDRPPRPQNVES